MHEPRLLSDVDMQEDGVRLSFCGPQEREGARSAVVLTTLHAPMSVAFAVRCSMASMSELLATVRFRNFCCSTTVPYSPVHDSSCTASYLSTANATSGTAKTQHSDIYVHQWARLILYVAILRPQGHGRAPGAASGGALFLYGALHWSVNTQLKAAAGAYVIIFSKLINATCSEPMLPA